MGRASSLSPAGTCVRTVPCQGYLSPDTYPDSGAVSNCAPAAEAALPRVDLGAEPHPVHPKVVGEAGQARAFELDDVSSRPKAATCRRTPKAIT